MLLDAQKSLHLPPLYFTYCTGYYHNFVTVFKGKQGQYGKFMFLKEVLKNINKCVPSTLVFEACLKLGNLQCIFNFNIKYVLLMMIEHFERN